MRTRPWGEGVGCGAMMGNKWVAEDMTQWQMLGHLNHVQEIKALLSK